VVEKSADLADDVVVGPNCYVGPEAYIGEGTILEANVVIGKGVQIGCGNHFFSNCVIGGQPQLLGLAPDSEVGGLKIGDNNTIREMATIHPSMHPDGMTRIGNGSLIMIGVHVGHDCELQDKLVLSNYAQISGHCRIESGVWLSGVVCVHQFVTIGKWCYAAGLAGINHDIPPFMIISGHYPPMVRGVNKRGMVRAGLSEESQEAVMAAYRRLYRRSSAPLLQTAREMVAEGGLDKNVQAILDAIINSSKHRFGRHLELFRH
jgi:UDP-N-acetylglucosamine acyltransferase